MIVERQQSSCHGTAIAARNAVRRIFIAVLLLLLAAVASAQDVLSLGSDSAAAGATANVTVALRDVSGTTLGVDAGSGNRIQGIAFKVLFDATHVQSVSFTRGGVLASLTPLYETTLQGSGWISYIATFAETTNAIPFTSNIANAIGTLGVTFKATAPNGTTIPLRFDAPGAMLSNQASTARESVSLGNLALVHGSVTVNGSISAPQNVLATNSGTSQVNVTWSAVAGAAHYEVWRSFNNSAYALIASPTATSINDTAVSPGTTYLYKVRAVDASSTASPFSAVDAATTIVFTDDPVSGVVKALHFTQLRTAINAISAAAGLAPIASDATIAAGQLIRAQHIAALRTALDQARAAIGLPALTHDTSSTIKSLQITQLRNGVK